MQRPQIVNFFLFMLILPLVWLLGRYLLPVGLPFALGAALALGAESAVSWLNRKLHLPRPLAAGIGVGSLFVLLATLSVLILAGLMRQLPRLSALAPQLEQAVVSGRDLLCTWLLELSGKLPGSIGILATQWTQGLFSGGTDLAAPFLQNLPSLATRAVSRLSESAFSLVTALIASFMLSARLPQLRQWLSKKLPEELLQKSRGALASLRQGLGGWLLAQLKLAAVTFGVLLVGFLLLRIRSSVVWAFLVALVDAFPVLGVGTVLIPWALVCLLQGQYARGIGLLAVYGVSWLLRQLLEPRLVGKGLGLDPLVTLIAIYAGFRLGGIPGMLLAPVFAMTAARLWQAWSRPAV